MKKMIAMWLALIMALSCIAAVAEEAPAFPGMTVTSALHIDREAAMNLLTSAGVAEEQMPLYEAALALLDAASEEFILAGNGMQYALSFNGQEALNLAGKMDFSGITVVSSLFPNSAVTVSLASILGMFQKMVESVAGSMEGVENSGIDFEKLSETLSGYGNDFVNACTASVTTGETEQGEFEFEGKVFNLRTPLNVDIEAIMEAYKTLIQQVLEDETVKAALEAAKSVGIEVDTTDAEAALNESFSTEELPAVNADVYTYVDEEGNQSDEVFVAVTVTPAGMDNPATFVNVLTQGSYVTVEVEIPAAQSKTVVSVEPADDGLNVRADFNVSGNYFAVAYRMIADEELHADLAFYFGDPENPLAVAEGNLAMQGELTLPVDTEGKDIVTVEDIMEQGFSAVVPLILDTVTNGLGATLTAINEAVPEAKTISDTITQAIQQMMGGTEAA